MGENDARPSMLGLLDDVLRDVVAERDRQDRRYGDRTMQDDLTWLTILAEEAGEVAGSLRGAPSYPLSRLIRDSLLKAEMYSRMYLRELDMAREQEPPEYVATPETYGEVVQLAAVAVAIGQALRARGLVPVDGSGSRDA